MINAEVKYFAPRAKEREKMINRIYKGVPDSVRGRLWYILLEIEQIKREKKGVYEQMKELARKSSPDIRQIDLVSLLLIIICQSANQEKLFFSGCQPNLS